ncbi:MAG TPA: hydroxymethylbilane synthase [Burkholderiaceae bacterium]|nr:hydroxymethylbilane synthase [Burkholderiaceae bacterium]
MATRASRLALWQAHHVRDRLLSLYPDCHVDLLEMTTKGDRILDRTLSKIGGKGLFVKELETALLDGRADLAVHSLKDVPVELTTPFSLPVIMERDDPRDAFVSNHYDSLADMPKGSVVGTSSLRRQAQIARRFPDLIVKPLRGNLDTRLKKLNLGEYDGIILAAVGLKRLELGHRIRSYLEVEDCLPCAGQGALGIETLEARPELHRWLQPLACARATACSDAERAVSRVLGGSCQVPLGAYAQVQDDVITVRALVAEPDGSTLLQAQASGPVANARAIGEQAAGELLDKGAREILSRLLAADQLS